MKRFLSAQLTGYSVLASALLMVASPVGAQTMKEGKAMSSGDEACQHRMMKQGAKHLTQMKAKLHLTPQQLPAWEAFSQTMNTIPAGMGGMGGMQDASAMEKMTTPERLEKMTAMHEAKMKQRREAVLTFYNQLSAEQQKTFDAQSWAMHKRHMQG